MCSINSLIPHENFVGREDIFKPTTGSESLHEISNDDGIRVVNFATSKNLTVESTMFPRCNIHKFTWTSPDGKTHNQFDYILIDRRRHSVVLDVRSFSAADCDACYHSVQNLLSSRLLSKNITIRIYKIIILPVVLFGCETWSLTIREEHRLRVLENRSLRRIGPKRDEVTEGWRNCLMRSFITCTLRHRMIKSRRM
jgi:hypothetical protein